MDETLFLTVNIVDKFLERQVVVRKKLQLVGVTAMLLACKYEEVSVPIVDDFILISDNAYTRKEVLDMVIFLSSLFRSKLAPSHALLTSFECSYVLAGETAAKHFTIQHVCTDPLCVHAEISQGSSI